MILPLLCASLLASAAVAPAVSPQKEDFSDFNTSILVRKDAIYKAVDPDNVYYHSFPIPNPLNDHLYLEFNFSEGLSIVDETGANPVLLGSDFVSNASFSGGACVVSDDGGAATYSYMLDYISFEDSVFSFAFEIPIDSQIQGDIISITVGTFSFDYSGNAYNFYCDDLIFLDLYSVSSFVDEGVYLNELVAPAPVSPDGVEIVGEIVSILGAGIGQLGSSIGQGVAIFVQSLAFDGNGNLSIYFIMVISLASVSLAIALTTRLFTWLTSLGN